LKLDDAAFALLEAHRAGKTRLTRKAGSLCGQLVTHPQPLTEAQADWIGKLLDRAGLPPIGGTDNA